MSPTMLMRPRISVLMSTRNDASTLSDAIDSILQQSYAHFEFLILDDNSTDHTSEILREYAQRDSRIVLFHSSQTRGLTVSLNTLLTHVTGEFIARMDADDVSLLNRFEKQVLYLSQHPDVVLCGTQGWYINEAGESVGEKNLPCACHDIKKRLLWNNQFIHSSWMVRTNTLQEMDGYNEVFIKSQDYELVLRIASQYTVANLPDRLISWRVRSSSSSWQNRQQEWCAIVARWQAITRYGYPRVYGMWCICVRLLWFLAPLYFKRRRYAH